MTTRLYSEEAMQAVSGLHREVLNRLLSAGFIGVSAGTGGRGRRRLWRLDMIVRASTVSVLTKFGFSALAAGRIVSQLSADVLSKAMRDNVTTLYEREEGGIETNTHCQTGAELRVLSNGSVGLFIPDHWKNQHNDETGVTYFARVVEGHVEVEPHDPFAYDKEKDHSGDAWHRFTVAVLTVNLSDITEAVRFGARHFDDASDAAASA